MPTSPPIAPRRKGRRPAAGAVQQRIVGGARRYFFAHGFRGVTMDDLAEELGMSKKTLYAHFPSKLALLHAVVCDKMSAVEADLERVVSGHSGGFTSQLQALLSCLRTHTEAISD